MIDVLPLMRLVRDLALYERRLARILAPTPWQRHLQMAGRCGVCLEIAMTSPCARCRSANRQARLAEGWDRPRDVVTLEDVKGKLK